jgi:large subunit ribosomal protein L14
MIYPQTRLVVADNTGAKVVECIKVLGGTTRGYASVGAIIVISVKKSLPNAKASKGTMHRAIIVRTISPIQRSDGTSVRFDNNAVVILNEKMQPLGTRIFGPVAFEVREKSAKIASLATEII